MKLKCSYGSLIVVALVLVVLTGIMYQPDRVSHAQGGGSLTYGSNAYATTTAGAPLIFYNFSGTAGDLVHVSVKSMTAGFDPMVDLVGPDQQVLASNDRHSLAFDPQDAQVSQFLPQTGVYTLMVGGANGTTGDFLLLLDGRGPVNSTPLVHGEVMPVSVPQGAPSQYFMFDTAQCPTTLVVLEPSDGEPFTFPYIVKVRDSQGHDVARLRGGDTLEDRVTVEALTGLYEVEVWSDDPMLAGTLSLLVTCGDQPAACLNADTAPEPAGGETVTMCAECAPCPPLEEDTDLCADFQVDVRQGTLGDPEQEGLVTVSWSEMEGVDHTIVVIVDETTDELVLGQYVETGNSTTIDFTLWDLPSGSYTVTVRTYATVEGDALCEKTTTLDYVSGEPPEDCEVDIVAPRETIANGLQTIFWTSVPHDTEEGVVYMIWVFGEFDTRVAEARMSAPATSVTLDLSEAAIGVGYSGENDFYLQVSVFRDGDSFWCSNGVRVTREP